jgi:hypothetical protein
VAKASAFSANFDEAAFREAIYETMLMGIPEDPAEALTFKWLRDRVYVPDDPAGNPYDWTSSPTSNTPGNPALPDIGGDQGLSVPYALEFSARPGGAATAFGEIDTSRAVVTLLDSDYDQVRTADYAVIGDTVYRILFDAPPFGLFGVTVWQVFLEAEDSA